LRGCAIIASATTVATARLGCQRGRNRHRGDSRSKK
jgi:hypothetical protein